MSYINSHQAQIDDVLEAHRLDHYEGLAKQAHAQNEAGKALSEIFGAADFVYIVGYSIYSPGTSHHLQCQDIFPGKVNAEGVDQAFLDAYGTYVDQDDPHRPNSSYRGCIRLDRNGTYARVKLFSGE